MELMLGGRCHFLPQGDDESCRLDDKDLIALAVQDGYTYIPDRSTFDSVISSQKASLPIIGLFSPGVPLPR
jgi:alkaline phosphatase